MLSEFANRIPVTANQHGFGILNQKMTASSKQEGSTPSHCDPGAPIQTSALRDLRPQSTAGGLSTRSGQSRRAGASGRTATGERSVGRTGTTLATIFA